jgi:hypothetical protein
MKTSAGTPSTISAANSSVVGLRSFYPDVTFGEVLPASEERNFDCFHVSEHRLRGTVSITAL